MIAPLPGLPSDPWRSASGREAACVLMDRRLCATTRCPQSVRVFFEDHRLKNRLIFASGFEREDDAALGGGSEGNIKERVLQPDAARSDRALVRPKPLPRDGRRRPHRGTVRAPAELGERAWARRFLGRQPLGLPGLGSRRHGGALRPLRSWPRSPGRWW